MIDWNYDRRIRYISQLILLWHHIKKKYFFAKFECFIHFLQPVLANKSVKELTACSLHYYKGLIYVFGALRLLRRQKKTTQNNDHKNYFFRSIKQFPMLLTVRVNEWKRWLLNRETSGILGYTYSVEFSLT